VLAIKQILHRTSRTSPIVAALAAAQRGKYVTAIVVLMALGRSPQHRKARNLEARRG
jgi:polyphosphate kinase